MDMIHTHVFSPPGQAGPRTSRPLPLLLSPHQPDFNIKLDFDVYDHDYQQQEEKMGTHLLPPVDEPVGLFPPAC